MPENPSVFHARSGFYLQDGDLIYILITNYSEDREYKIKKKNLIDTTEYELCVESRLQLLHHAVFFRFVPSEVNVKLKQSRYRPEGAQKVPGI